MSTNHRKIWCRNCNHYYNKFYYKEHLKSKLHLDNVQQGVENEQPLPVQIQEEPMFQIDDPNIEEIANFKNGTSVKYLKTMDDNNTKIDVDGFSEIVENYYNRYKKPFILYLSVSVEYKREQNGEIQYFNRCYTTHKSNVFNINDLDFSTHCLNKYKNSRTRIKR